jgi:hypothetical protein
MWIEPDRSLDEEISIGRTGIIEATIASPTDKPGDVAAAVRASTRLLVWGVI